jgi:hypothetical protein
LKSLEDKQRALANLKQFGLLRYLRQIDTGMTGIGFPLIIAAKMMTPTQRQFQRG